MKIILISLVLLLTVGCVSIKWNPITGEVEYSRFGDQKLSGIHIEDANGLYVAIESQESQAKLMTDAIEAAVKLYELGRLAP
jgi:hypothetical protein